MISINERGEGKGGAIFGFTLLAIVIYLAWTIIPVMIRVYGYEDKVKEEAKFTGRRGWENLEKTLLKFAAEEELPVSAENVEVKLQTNNILKVDITYTVPISTPVKVFMWDQEIHYEAPIFD